jgi:hypothetical protein
MLINRIFDQLLSCKNLNLVLTAILYLGSAQIWAADTGSISAITTTLASTSLAPTAPKLRYPDHEAIWCKFTEVIRIRATDTKIVRLELLKKQLQNDDSRRAQYKIVTANTKWICRIQGAIKQAQADIGRMAQHAAGHATTNHHGLVPRRLAPPVFTLD